MKKVLSIIMIMLALLVLASCTNDVSDPINYVEGDSWEGVFKEFWETMSLEYVHFSEEEGLDWDEVYEKYLPHFQELDWEKESDTLTAFSYFKAIVWQLSDYHYSLMVNDNFGNYIMISPSTLQKMKKAHSDWDINDYPDVYSMKFYLDENKKLAMKVSQTSINAGFDNPIVKNMEDKTDPGFATVKKYEAVVEGTFEVKELTAAGVFHNGSTDFTKGYEEGSFALKTRSDSKTDLTDAEKAWNTAVQTLGLDGFSYCYGLTDKGFFYFYISAFPSTSCLEPLLYQETLTVEERKTLEKSGLDVVHDALWCQNVDAAHKYTELTDLIAELKGISNLIKQLRNIGGIGKCTFDGVTWEVVGGVIMDVRSNGGGSADFLCTLMGSFFEEEVKIGEVRYRDSYSRYNYTPWTDFYLEQSYCNTLADDNYSNPFVVLANGSSVSCSEISCMIAKHLPKAKIVGGQTYGGTCALTDRRVFQSGPYKNGNIYIYTTTYQTKDSSGSSLETVGITPDVAVKYQEGSDERYKKALETAFDMLSAK